MEPSDQPKISGAWCVNLRDLHRINNHIKTYTSMEWIFSSRKVPTHCIWRCFRRNVVRRSSSSLIESVSALFLHSDYLYSTTALSHCLPYQCTTAVREFMAYWKSLLASSEESSGPAEPSQSAVQAL